MQLEQQLEAAAASTDDQCMFPLNDAACLESDGDTSKHSVSSEGESASRTQLRGAASMSAVSSTGEAQCSGEKHTDVANEKAIEKAFVLKQVRCLLCV